MEDMGTISRRRFIMLAASAVAVPVLAGCGGGSLFSGAVGLIVRPVSLTLNPTRATLATDLGRDTCFLSSFSNSGIQASLWGVKSADDVINAVTQFLAWDESADNSVRVLRDGRGLPSQIIDESNGAFIVIVWETDRATFKLFQPDGAYIGGAEVRGSAGAFVISQLSDSKIVGYFSGTLTGATGGIFAFAVGGRENNRPAGSRPTAEKRAEVTPKAVDPVLAKKLTDSLVLALSTTSFTAFAKALLGEIQSQFKASGSSSTFTAILNKALAGTGLSGFFRDGGNAVLRGLLAHNEVLAVAQDYADRLANSKPLDGLSFAENSPGLTSYVSTTNIVPPNQALDTTGVVGVMLAQEFGSIPVYGVIDGTGRITVDGTGGGVQVHMNGTATDTSVSGSWEAVNTRSRDVNGSFNGALTPLGQCSAQQNSGGQGTFTNAYDLQKCGKFPFSYDAYTIPDHFIVINGGNTIFDTGGLVSGGTTVQLTVSANSTIVQVTVQAPEDGTAWEYTVGCPA